LSANNLFSNYKFKSNQIDTFSLFLCCNHAVWNLGKKNLLQSQLTQARNQGGVQWGQVHPLSTKRGVQWRICPPPFLNKLHVRIFFWTIESILAFKVVKINYHSVYCKVYIPCLNNSLQKLFPQTNQIKPSLKDICPGVKFSEWTCLLLFRICRYTYVIHAM